MAATQPRAADTRRALLARAGAVAGVAGAAGAAAALGRADVALAATRDELKFDGFNNVKDFGAVGNGIADDTAAIQDCIEQSAGVATVYFPPGVFKLTASLRVVSQSRLVGHGALSVIKADPAVTQPTIINTFDNGQTGFDDITIEDLTLDSNNKTSVYAIKLHAPEADLSRRIFIRRVEVKNHTLAAPAGSNPGAVITLRRIDVGAVEDCYVHHAQRDGILVAACRDFVISGNVVEACCDDHIVAPASQNVAVVGNVVDARTTTRGAAIQVYGSVSVVGNITYGGAHAGIEVRAGGQDALVAANAVLEAGNTDGTARNEPVGWGTPKGSGVSVLLQAASTVGIPRVAIRDNFVLSPRNHGVLVASAADQPVTDIAIDGNTIWMGPPAVVRQPDPTLAGMGVAVTGPGDALSPVGAVENVRVARNDIRRSKGPGIFVRGSRNKRWDVLDNTVLDSGTGNASPQPGIVIDGFAGFAVNDNRSQDTRTTGKTQSHGLRIANTSGVNAVTNNDFSGNATGAIDRSAVNASTHIFENLGDDLAAS